MENIKLLSGKQLIQHGTKKNSQALPSKSPKIIIPTKSWLEKKQIENSIETKKSLIAEQRIEKRNNLSHAEWIADIKKAIVTEKRGNHWRHIGHSCDDKIYLYPEEALYLIEINALLLKFSNIPVSIQQAYSLLLGESISLLDYRVYSLLSKEGYKLLRHEEKRQYSDVNNVNNNGNASKSNKNQSNNISRIKTSETKKRIDDSNQPIEKNISKCKDDILMTDDVVKSSEILADSSDDCLVIAEDCGLTLENNRKRHIDELSSSQADLPNNNEEIERKRVKNSVKRKKCLEKEKEVIEIVERLPQFKSEPFNSIVDCYKKKIILIPAPDKKYLPPNLTLLKKQYIINILKLNEKENPFAISCINNTNENSALVLNRIQRSQGNSCTYGSHRQSNFFSNNTYFFNHIFQQVSIKQISCNTHYERFSYSQLNNNLTVIQSPRCTGELPPFSAIGDPRRSNNRSVLNPFSQNALQINPYSKNKPTEKINPIEIQNIEESESESTDLCIPDSTSNPPDGIQNKYTKLLFKLKHVLSKSKSSDIEKPPKRMQNTLSLILNEYNTYFKQNFILNEQMYEQNGTDITLSSPNVESTSKENEMVVHLSSSTDNSIDVLSNKNKRKMYRKTKRKSKSLNNDKMTNFQHQTASSSEDSDLNYRDTTVIQENQHSSKRIDKFRDLYSACSSKNVDLSDNKIDNDENMKDIFQGWLSKYEWCKPERVHTKIINNSDYMTAHCKFLSSIKKFSSDDKSAVQSWKQAKRLYKGEEIPETVSISDDEDVSEKSNCSSDSNVANNWLTVKVDRIEPLIRPADCTSVLTVLDRLQIVRSYQDTATDEGLHECDVLKISYDAYLPNFKDFKKSNPPSPAYCIVIKSHLSPTPTPRALSEIRSKLPKKVRLLIAVVSYDHVLFLEMENIQLPNIADKPEHV